jgi:hypothetical protein
MPAGLHNLQVPMVATVGYPGSKVTDIIIGGHKVQIPNDCLRRACVDMMHQRDMQAVEVSRGLLLGRDPSDVG